MKELLFHVSQQGIHGLYLMIFTLLIWIVFFLILVANPYNKRNRWCFFAGLLFSLGTLKEFLYYELGGLLFPPVAHAIPNWLYSVLSGCFYFFSTPCGLVFALYFSNSDLHNLKTFHIKQTACFMPPILMLILFPFTQILYSQSSTVFCLTVAAYNWIYGTIITVILLKTIWAKRLTENYHQYVLVASSLLIPIWAWLIMAFPFHALGLEGISKAWQLNFLVVAIVLVFILYHAFHEGIWGLRLRREKYDWNTGKKLLQGNAHYVEHALKNGLAKISWCTNLLRQKNVSSTELDVIERSVAHLEHFIACTQIYSNEIVLKSKFCNVADIFENLTAHNHLPDHIQLKIGCCDPEPLYCDPVHLEEVLQNLIYNAVESIKEEGVIQLTYHCRVHRRHAVISVIDNGCGIAKKDIKKISEPFYTTKETQYNMGLGLYYCRNVMLAHSGRLQISSTPGEGSTFSLFFPYKAVKRSTHEKNQINDRRGR